MLCGVTATLGSNPSATATAARPHWGRAVLLCLRGVCGACCPDRSPAAARPARPRAVRAASFARCVVSKPGQAPQASRRPPIGRGVCVLRGQALPPPTGTAAGPSGALRRPPHQWCQVSDVARCVGLLFGQAPPPPVGVTGVSCVEFLGWSGVCCYKRRQSDGFLAENGRYRSVRAMTSRKSRM